VEPVLRIIKDGCTSDISVESGEQNAFFSDRLSSAKAKVGGAVVFVWDLDKFEVY